MAEEVQKKRSPWVYVGLGCAGGLVLLCGLGVLIVGGLVKVGKDWADDMADPSRRESKARKQAVATLGAVPEGYSAAFSFGFPMVFEMLVFVDAPLLPDGGAPAFTRLLTYWRFMETERTREMKQFFENPDAGSFQNENLLIDTKAELGRGTFTHQNRKVSWIANRGTVRMQGQYDMEDGLVTTLYFECPGDQVHIATWQMKEPKDTDDLAGTVADPAQMQKLLSPLNPCGK
ncbi:MAG: hypothetical protein IPJ65_24035 [Archangiaceae bacterium]|nr:hypothetical protein [Archangiaceae bacterium]